jgi:enoyl-CoA hydratase
MSSHCISLTHHGEIAVIRLNRPPANAICLELCQEFEAALDADMVAEARAIVVTGTGRFFSGGLDLNVVPTYSKEEQRDFLGLLNSLSGRLYAHPTPVVAAVNGHAVAGGFMLALTTDYRIGPTGTAEFGLTEARVGIPFPAATMIILRAELAPQDVRYSVLSARTFGPNEAQRRGVLDELQPPEGVLERAIEVAHDMANMPADGYRRIKYQVRESAIAEIEEVISTGADPLLEDWYGAGVRETSAALLE